MYYWNNIIILIFPKYFSFLREYMLYFHWINSKGIVVVSGSDQKSTPFDRSKITGSGSSPLISLSYSFSFFWGCLCKLNHKHFRGWRIGNNSFETFYIIPRINHQSYHIWKSNRYSLFFAHFYIELSLLTIVSFGSKGIY